MNPDGDVPTRPRITSLDLSGFHPLDHPLWRCRDYPGGWRRHLSYWWEFKAGPQLGAATWCRLGRHRPSTWWGGGERWEGCIRCAQRLSDPVPDPDGHPLQRRP